MSPRFLVVNRTLAGRTVVDLLRSHFRLTPADVRQLLKRKGILLSGVVCRDLTLRVRSGQKLRVEFARDKTDQAPTTVKSHGGKTRPAAAKREQRPQAHDQPREPKIHVVFMDKHIVVVDKPAGLTTVRHAGERAEFGDRAQRFLPPTLLDLLGAQLSSKYPHGRLRAVHRLDKETSGLVVLARTAQAERGFGLQFRAHDVSRTYLALVRGRAKNAAITSYLIRDRGDGRRGSGPDQRGQKAITHVRVVEELGEFTLVECRLETGRTHQIRIHLGEQESPLCGERIYDRPCHGQPRPDTSGAGRPALHAATLDFNHPVTKKHLQFASPLPSDLHELIQRLRKSASVPV
jgi:23S rRNA pseudouridine1911/1915/1917 synthase